MIKPVTQSPVQSRYSKDMVKNKSWVYAKTFKGEPKLSDFELHEAEVPLIKDGEILCEALYLSVDPYMRAYVTKLDALGSTMFGSQVARVIESKNPNYKVGSNIMGMYGWQLYSVVNPDNFTTILGNKELPLVLPDFDGLSASLSLGILGMPGCTAYFGFLEICKPQPSEVVVVSGAAGAVGSAVGQIAKIKGCNVIGIAGSSDKLKWLKDELHFDGVINYKEQDVTKALRELAPNGVDCYFDNVGGEVSSQVINQMNKFGRISVCGSISSYNDKFQSKASVLQLTMVIKELKMEGFVVYRWQNRFSEAIKQNLNWIKQGKLKYRETVTEGFLKMPEAFIGMMNGENFGKAIVKV